MEKFVGAIIVTKDNKLALQKRDNKPKIANPGMVTVFGGQAEKGEETIEAMIRELKEELLIDVAAEELELFLEFEKYSPWLKENILAYIFILKNIEAKDLKIQEGEKILFIEPIEEEVKKLNLSGATNKALFEYLKKY